MSFQSSSTDGSQEEVLDKRRGVRYTFLLDPTAGQYF